MPKGEADLRGTRNMLVYMSLRYTAVAGRSYRRSGKAISRCVHATSVDIADAIWHHAFCAIQLGCKNLRS